MKKQQLETILQGMNRALTTRYTPGPWNYRQAYDNGEPACLCIEPMGYDLFMRDETENEANARLIAAAPLLYNYVASKANSGDNEAQDIINQIEGK